jgi:hypothetical protein
LRAGTRDQPPAAASYPGVDGRELAMFLTVLIVIIAVLMIVALPRLWRKR